MKDRRPWLLLAAATVIWSVAELQWGLGLHWDEIEFFRATRWVGEGRLPYRDFWEHHTPLQWFLFAPLARWFGNGCGVAAIVHMRWAQLPLWIGIVALLIRWMRRLEVPPIFRTTALILLGASTFFATEALEYRVDVIGNLLFIGGLTLMARQRAWVVCGVLLALSVLANIRLAPLVVAAALIAFFMRLDERRWAWNARAPSLLIGAAAVAASFVAYLTATRSPAQMVNGLLRYNMWAEGLGQTIEHNSVWSILIRPVPDGDVAGFALLSAGIAGAVIALREIRTPAPAQLLALIAIASLFLQFRLTMHYPYHLQTFYLLSVPLSALAVSRIRAERISTFMFAVIVLSLGIPIARSVSSFGERLRYQDRVMCAASALTEPADVVFDGCGYALERQPAYRYWFLPAGLQLMAARGLVEPYDLRELLQRPPGAIVYTQRVFDWFSHFPRLGSYVSRHYLPVYRNLWIPGMSVRLDGSGARMRWLVPRSGRYRVYASDIMARHPWFQLPLKYGIYAAPDAADLIVPLARFQSTAALTWSVDGRPVAPDAGILSLERGNVLSVTSAQPGSVGVFVVREGVRELFIAPSGSFEF